MARQQAIELVRGDTAQLTVTVTRPDDAGVPVIVDITGALMWFTVKRDPDDADADALIRKNMASGITFVHPTLGVARIDLDPADTAVLTVNQAPVYDIQLVEAAGRVTTVVNGTVVVIKDVTTATS